MFIPYTLKEIYSFKIMYLTKTIKDINAHITLSYRENILTLNKIVSNYFRGVRR